MACQEYNCTECEWEEFTNGVIHKCPECGAPVKAHFDETVDELELGYLDNDSTEWSM